MKRVAKISVIASVALFCLAMGCQLFVRLSMTDYRRSFNLYTLVPSSSMGVLESEDISAFLYEMSRLNYSAEFERYQFPGLLNFILNGLSNYADRNTHGLSRDLNRLLVSFHAPGTPRDQVVYFHTTPSDEELFADMLREYAPSNFLPKTEVYRGKRIVVYPLGYTEYLSAYSEDGFLAVSFQKKLIEQVIDTRIDGNSLAGTPVFGQLQEGKKNRRLLSLYSRSQLMSMLGLGEECWSGYDIHLNSDVLYLTGDTYLTEGKASSESVSAILGAHPWVWEEGLMISADRDSTDACIASLDAENPESLFQQCVSNLSQDADYSMVVDMQKVWNEKERFKKYLPTFVLENCLLFRPFILSVQYSVHDEELSHFWIFTYKD